MKIEKRFEADRAQYSFQFTIGASEFEAMEQQMVDMIMSRVVDKIASHIIREREGVIMRRVSETAIDQLITQAILEKLKGVIKDG